MQGGYTLKGKTKNISLDPTYENIDFLTNYLNQEWDINNIGVFISLLSYKYINNYEINKNDFLKKLSESIDKLKGY